MSKVKLITVVGYGNQGIPRIGGSEEVIDLGIEIPDTKDIMGIIRTDFDPDDNGDKRVSDELIPAIRYERINNLVGRLLTLADAMFTDPEQRKAAKDTLQKEAWSWYHSQTDDLTEPWRIDKFPKYKEAFDVEN